MIEGKLFGQALFARNYRGGGGDSGSAAQGQAELQLANISQQQWDYFQNTWLPQATGAAAQSDATAKGVESQFQNNIIPSAQSAEANLTAQAGQSAATNNNLAAQDTSLANQQVGIANQDTAQAGVANDAAAGANAQAGIQNGAFNQYGVGDLANMQAMSDYYLSSAGQQQEAGIAAGNVTQQFANANQQAIAAGQQRGINAASGQMGSIINQNDITEAAASAAAQTQARQAALSLGWQYNAAAQQAGAAMGNQATANTNAATGALNSANSSLSNANATLIGAGTNTSNASSAANSAVANQQAVGSGISTVQNAVSGAQAAAGIPLSNLSTIASGISGGANSSSGAASQEGNIAGQQAATQAQQNQANSAGIGSALGAAAAIGTTALVI